MNEKILMIAPSNSLFMPYVETYYKYLYGKCDLYLVCWDRFQNEREEFKKFIFKDKKVGHSRNIIDYFKYKLFVEKIIDENSFDKIIVFGIQLAFFLRKILSRYREKYILDIRDHHKLIKFYNVQSVVENSFSTVISSEGYKSWLPKSEKYIVNHNLYKENLELLDYNSINNTCINIGYVGALAHYDENVHLIEQLKNNSKFNLKYYGLGTINENLKNYINENNIINVEVKGIYERKEENQIYAQIDFINILLDNNKINNKTCMANRFYNAVIFGKPIIINMGSYMASIVEKYELGVIIKNRDSLLFEIEKYVENFNCKKYEKNRENCFRWLKKEENKFKSNLDLFLQK